MNLDPTFRSIMNAGFLVMMPIALYFRLKSRVAGEHFDRRAEGRFVLGLPSEKIFVAICERR